MYNVTYFTAVLSLYHLRIALRGVLIMTPLLGLTWLLEFVGYSIHVAFAYLPYILNGLQVNMESVHHRQYTKFTLAVL